MLATFKSHILRAKEQGNFNASEIKQEEIKAGLAEQGSSSQPQGEKENVLTLESRLFLNSKRSTREHWLITWQVTSQTGIFMKEKHIMPFFASAVVMIELHKGTRGELEERNFQPTLHFCRICRSSWIDENMWSVRGFIELTRRSLSIIFQWF